MIIQLFENLCLRSKNNQGIDRDIFVRFSPIQVSNLLIIIIINLLGNVGSSHI